MKWRSTNTHKGFGLIQAMIVIAFVGIAAILSVSTVAHQFKVRKAMVLKGQIADLRTLAQSRVDCRQTLIVSGVECSFDHAIPGLDASGGVVIAAPEQLYGNTLALRVMCGPTVGVNRISLEYKVYSSSGTTAPHPLTGHLLDWQSVTLGIPVTCQP